MQIHQSTLAAELLKEAQALKETDTCRSEQLASEAAMKGKETGEWLTVGEALLVIAYCHYRCGKFSEMLTIASEGLALFTAEQDEFRAVKAHHFLGMASIYLSKYSDAISHLQKALATFEALNGAIAQQFWARVLFADGLHLCG